MTRGRIEIRTPIDESYEYELEGTVEEAIKMLQALNARYPQYESFDLKEDSGWGDGKSSIILVGVREETLEEKRLRVAAAEKAGSMRVKRLRSERDSLTAQLAELGELDVLGED